MGRQDAKFAKIRESSGSEPDEELDCLARVVIGAAIEVHRHLGPGFLESTYERALCVELRQRMVPFESQAPVRVFYKGEPVAQGRVDLLVANRLAVELMAVESVSNLHVAQTLAYLKALALPLGLLLNFQVPIMAAGIRRVIRT